MLKYGIVGTLICWASAVGADTSDLWQFEIGGGGTLFYSPWKGVALEQTPLPYFNASFGRWGFGVGEGLVQYKVIDSKVDIGIGLGYRDETYQSDFSLIGFDSDDPVFNDYESPKGEFTARAQVDYGLVHFRLSRDIQGHSNAVTALIHTDIPLYRHSSGWQVAGRVGLYWMQDKYASYVYGVNETNTDDSIGRFKYSLGNTLNDFAGLRVFIPLTKHHSLRGLYRYESLDRDVVGSPLVGRSYRSQFSIMYVVNL